MTANGVKQERVGASAETKSAAGVGISVQRANGEVEEIAEPTIERHDTEPAPPTSGELARAAAAEFVGVARHAVGALGTFLKAVEEGLRKP